MDDRTQPVSLSRIVRALDVPNEAWVFHINCRTGELCPVVVTTEPRYEEHVDDGDTELPEGPTGAWTRDCDVDEAPAFVALPRSFDVDEHGLRESFAALIVDAVQREAMLVAARGPEAQARFTAELWRQGLETSWRRFREQALRDAVADWLDARGIPYRRDDGELTAR